MAAATLGVTGLTAIVARDRNVTGTRVGNAGRIAVAMGLATRALVTGAIAVDVASTPCLAGGVGVAHTNGRTAIAIAHASF